MKQRILLFFGATSLSVACAFGLSYSHCLISGSGTASCVDEPTSLARLNSDVMTADMPQSPVFQVPPVVQAPVDRADLVEPPVPHARSASLDRAPHTATTPTVAAPASIEAETALKTEIETQRISETQEAQPGMDVLYSTAPFTSPAQPRLSTMSPVIAPYSETAFIGPFEEEAVPNYLIGVYR
ncbi:hypothetical protein [Celeribacter naphthalenivorans]|uniref:hypothetical protein n=1 Tax=Celeribacter naphthalenivorans TaxID=1614694 RepID=UPI001CFB63AA|nr:hypothetical protein [Celeribacter naphthalenivorans]